MMFLGLLRPLLAPLLLILLIVVIFFSGDFHGRGIIQSRWNKETANQAALVAAEHARWEKAEQAYTQQLAQAQSQLDHNRDLLARLRRAPVPHLLCHAASGGSPVPGFPGAPGVEPAGAGALPPSPDFDPSERLYAQVADPSDNTVEECRDLYNRWPH